MGCIMRPYFRGGRVSETNEVGALEGTNVSLNGGRSPHSFSYKKCVLLRFFLFSFPYLIGNFTERRPWELPDNSPPLPKPKKCCLLIFLASTLYTLHLTPYALQKSPYPRKKLTFLQFLFVNSKNSCNFASRSPTHNIHIISRLLARTARMLRFHLIYFSVGCMFRIILL